MTTAHHPDRFNIDEFLQTCYANGGYAHDRPIPFWEWRNSEGDDLGNVGVGVVGKAAINLGTTDLQGIQWAFDADASDIIYWFGQVPMNYDPATDKLRLVVRVRKNDAADENADLELELNARWFDSASVGGETLAAELSSGVLAASTAGTDWDDFEEVIFDLDGKGLKPGALLELQLHPNEQVGSTNMTLDMISARLDYRAGVSHYDRSLRTWA